MTAGVKNALFRAANTSLNQYETRSGRILIQLPIRHEPAWVSSSRKLQSDNMPREMHITTEQRTSTAGIIAIAAAIIGVILSFFGHPFWGIITSLLAVIVGLIGLVVSASPRVGGGLVSLIAVVVGIFGLGLAVLVAVGVIIF